MRETAPVVDLLSIAEAGPLDELARAHVLHVRGQIVFAQQRGRDAFPLLLQAARRLGMPPSKARQAEERALRRLAADGDVKGLRVAA